MAAARLPCELGCLLTRPVLQAVFGAVAGVALAAPQNCSGRQLQLLLQAAARGAVQGAASSPVEETGPLAEELEARLSAVRPVLVECISAAHGTREPHIPGTQRVRRNLAEHFGFGQGAEVLEGSGRVLRERQRGVRRADRPGPGALLVHCGAAADTGPALEEGGRDAAPPGATSSPGARGPAPSVRPAVAPPPPEGKFIEVDGPCQPLQRAAGMVLEPSTWLLPGEPSERHSVDRTESDSMHMPAKSGERWADCTANATSAVAACWQHQLVSERAAAASPPEVQPLLDMTGMACTARCPSTSSTLVRNRALTTWSPFESWSCPA